MDALMELTIIGPLFGQDAPADDEGILRKGNAAVGEIKERTHPLFDGDAGERLAENRGVGRAGSQGGKPAWVSAELKHGHLLWIAAELFDGQLGGVIGSGTEAADRQLFAVKFGGRLDLRPNDELERERS